MKRTLPALKLKNSPLVLVLVQVRIAPVMKMADFIPDIQERLRRNDLPRFSAGQDIQIQIGPTGIGQQRARRWEFQNKDQTRSVVISQDFIAMQTTAYDIYEDFEAFFRGPLAVLEEIVQPGLVQRVGLRYVDLVRPAPGQTLATYLKPGLLGLDASQIGAHEPLARFELAAKTDVGTMLIRCHQTTDGSPFPPDLRNNALALGSTIADGLAPGELVAILDLDHFNAAPVDYDTEQLVVAIGALHDNLDQAFRAAVTKDAIKAWGGAKRSSK